MNACWIELAGVKLLLKVEESGTEVSGSGSLVQKVRSEKILGICKRPKKPNISDDECNPDEELPFVAY